MLVSIHDNKLQNINSLSINLSDRNAYLDVETFRLIMLHYSDNQVTDKRLCIHHNVNYENTAVLRYITIVPEFFNSISTVIETQLTNISDLFLEACTKIANQTHIAFKVHLTTMDDLPKITNNIQRIKNLIPDVSINIYVEFSNEVCEWMLNHTNDVEELSNVPQIIFGSSYYSNDMNKEYYSEKLLNEFFEFYFNHDCTNNVVISSLYTHLVRRFTNKINNNHLNQSILINSDESVSVVNLDNMIINPTKFTWSNIYGDVLSECILINNMRGYRSEFTNEECVECVMKNKCEFYTDILSTRTALIPRHICYNRLLVYKVWSERYSEFLRHLIAICNDNIQEKLTISKEAINILDKLHGGKI